MENKLLGLKVKYPNSSDNNENNINEEEKEHCSIKEWNKKYKCYKYCKLPICKNKNNLNYCGNHLPLGEEGPNGIMTKCEICNQNIGSKIMENHLKKCKKNNEKKYKAINNENIITPRLWIKKKLKLGDVDEKLINNLSEKIKIMFEKINPKIIENKVLKQEILTKFSNEELNGKNNKNLKQEISIYCNALEGKIFEIESKEKNGQNKILIIELGCGAGGLSKTFQICDNNKNNLSFLLIDRMKYRSKNKYDNVIKSKLKNGELKREIIDIKDLSLNNYFDKYNNFCFISKHLCGEACEISLNKIVNLINDHKKEIIYKKFYIIIATCCHYLLNFETYCNFKLFEEYNFNKEEFDLLTRLSSWSTLKDENNKNYKLGKQIKTLLDYGRCLYLEKNGFKEVKLIEYINSDITKENIIILAKF